MLSVSEALAAVLERCAPRPATRLSLADAAGCVLAEDVASDVDMPPFDKALVDGYAVRASGEGVLRVVEEITAGRVPSRSLAAGEAAAIMTGAPVPDGTEAVVMVEKTRRDGQNVHFDLVDAVPGRNILPRGREVRAGDRILEAGVRLTPIRLGLLVAAGRTSVLAVPRPSVAVASTGDELVDPGQVPGPGQIRNSNSTTLVALATKAGARVENLPTARDEGDELLRTLSRGLKFDVLLVSGGVSAGVRDLVPGVLERLGVSRVFHKINLKPGKPLWFGTTGDEIPRLVFGLPGNPMSGVCCFELFVRPALNVLAGRPPNTKRTVPAPLRAAHVHRGERPAYLPARLVEAGVELVASAGSGDLNSLARAEGFAIFPQGDRDYKAGEIVQFLPLD